MNSLSINLQRKIESKLARTGLLLRKLDILVMNGNVNLTGRFISQELGRALRDYELFEIKRMLLRIHGVESVCFRVVENPGFA